jgi:hypothetical protein
MKHTPALSPTWHFPPPASHLKRAGRLVQILATMLVSTVFLGRNWDAWWHATYRFETFYSPPHLFILSMCCFMTSLVGTMIWSPTLRTCFGPGFMVPGLRFEVPGALALLASGFLLLGVGGLVLDNLWHTSFGLDETAWSFPHALMAWALLLTLLSCIGARLALLRRQAWRWPTAVLWAFLILSFSASPFLGPLNKNATPGIVQAIAAIPTLRDQSTAAHTARIYLEWSLDRTNPLIMLLAAGWAGVVLRLIQRLDQRSSVLLAAIGVWSLLVAWAEYATAQWLATFAPISVTPAAWLPLPLLPTAAVWVAAQRLRWPSRWAWISAGAAFSGCIAIVWGASPAMLLGALLAVPILRLGAAVGDWIFDTLERPTLLSVKALVVASMSLAFVSGIADLYLRWYTP